MVDTWNPEKQDLSDFMGYDAVVEIPADGRVIRRSDLHAPEVCEYLDAEGQSVGEPFVTGKCGWSLWTGYSSQQGYSGASMHQSESVGGGLERDMLAEPGLYAAVTISFLYPTEDQDDDSALGWVLAFKESEK
ncbi:hypothetical protein OG563_26630 [Nocardia vinacea]|uniref:Uncharacterized protein n=1 Tax=Nocardia vinacea TaxID=96468 RepID=A0ABZ1YHW7_9NOCA|nr:hypothetical protein [Nocardia vinacea]